MSGRAIASPVIEIVVMPYFATASHTRCGSNFGRITLVRPFMSPPRVPHCAAPCMSGASTRVAPGSAALASFDSLYSSSMRSPVTKSMPPPRVRHTSSCRHITPFGKPVVPPV